MEQAVKAWVDEQGSGRPITLRLLASRCSDHSPADIELAVGFAVALPAQAHLTLPSAWRSRRFRVPAGVVLHHADVSPEDRAWFGPVPATNARCSLNDCAREGTSPDLLRQAAQQALRRGLVTRVEISEVENALRPFGGLAA